jgi:calcium uptake protein 1, mitochondrial
MCALRSHPPAMAEAEAVLAPAALEKSLCAWKGRWLAAAGFAISAGMATAEAEHQRGDDVEKGWHLLSLDQRRRAFFNYEKRIREFSPPEKIFEYFASLGDVRHGFVMTAADVMRSVVPVFPPMDSEILRAGSLPGEPQPIVPQQVKIIRYICLSIRIHTQK